MRQSQTTPGKLGSINRILEVYQIPVFQLCFSPFGLSNLVSPGCFSLQSGRICIASSACQLENSRLTRVRRRQRSSTLHSLVLVCSIESLCMVALMVLMRHPHSLCRLEATAGRGCTSGRPFRLSRTRSTSHPVFVSSMSV